jgi:hypothetical protein
MPFLGLGWDWGFHGRTEAEEPTAYLLVPTASVVYDMPSSIATYLLIEGFAEIEMRRDQGHPPANERRKQPSKS